MALEQFGNSPTPSSPSTAWTLLSGAISAGATSLTLLSATPFPTVAQFRLLIDDELILVTALAGAVATVTRGIEGTTAASHSSGASIFHILTAAGLGLAPRSMTTAGDVEYLGATGAPTRLAAPSNGDYVTRWTSGVPSWVVASVGGDVTQAGSNTFTGVNTFNTPVAEAFTVNYVDTGLAMTVDSGGVASTTVGDLNTEYPIFSLRAHIGGADAATANWYMIADAGGNHPDVKFEYPGGAGLFEGASGYAFDAAVTISGAAVATASSVTAFTNKSGDISQWTNDASYTTLAAVAGVGYLTSVTAHNLLSATHGDTLTDSVVRGDLIVGNSTPKWARLAIGTVGKLLQSDGTDVSWAAPTGTGTPVLATSPTIVTPTIASFANAAHTHLDAAGGGTITAAAISDLGSAAVAFTNKTGNVSQWTNDASYTTLAAVAGVGYLTTLTAHNLLSATHGDTTAGTVARGDLITGQGASAKWVRLAKGTANQVLAMDGTATDIAWTTLAGGGDALTANPLSQFAATTSLQLKGVISDETGSGALVFATSPTFATTGTLTRDALGATRTDGWVLQNTTPAAAGAQQRSPSLVVTGQGWSTNSGGASMAANWAIDTLPVQGAAAPTSRLLFSHQINAAGFVAGLEINTTSLIFYDVNGTTKIMESNRGGLNRFEATSFVTIADAGVSLSSNQGMALGYRLQWANDNTWYGTKDTEVGRDGAVGVLGQYSGTIAQAYRLYNTRTSSTNYERLEIDWITSANNLLIGAQKGSGGGTARAMKLVYGGTSTAAVTVPITSGNIVFGGGVQLSNAAVTGLVAGTLAATTNASIVLYDSAGQAYRVPCII